MINEDWDKLLKEEYEKEYFNKLITFIDKEYKEKEIYPPKDKIFNAFKYTSYDDIKVVILGQDPYHGENEAEGLSFSVPNNIKRPPSLKNIFKELENDLNIHLKEHNSLIPWSKQGILLLNSVLTVEKDKPASHKNKGWEIFTDNIIKLINKKTTSVVFILWGNYAIEKEKLITNKNHLIIKSSHPSPFSARHSFFNSKPFSKTNSFLIKNNLKPINWNIEKSVN